MKHFLIITLAVLSLYANEQQGLNNKIDSIINVITQETDTVSKSQIRNLDNPFITVTKEKTTTEEGSKQETSIPQKKKVVLNLQVIINSKAKINTQWVKAGDYVHGYKVSFIGRNYVKLNYKNRYTKFLYLNKPENTIIQKGKSHEK